MTLEAVGSTNDLLGKKLWAIHRDLIADKQLWNHLWREIAELVMPRKSNIFGNTQVYREYKRYDATAMNGNERLAASIVGTMTPQTLDWFDLTMPMPMGVPRSQALDMWFRTVQQRMHDTMNQSNFASELEEVFLDIGAFGTGCLFIQEKDPGPDQVFGGLEFQSWPIQDYYIAEGADGMVNRIHRVAQFPIRQVAERYGTEKFTEKMKKWLEETPMKKVSVLQAIWEPLPKEKIHPELEKFPVASVVMVNHTTQDRSIIQMGGFNEFPTAVGRWRKVSGEVYGRGPGMTALPDIQVLNHADKLGLEAWANQILPPLAVLHEGVLGKPDLRPRRINTVQQEGAISFLTIPQNVNADLVRRQEKQASIREIFFMDQIQFIPERGKTPASATEIQARMNIMLQILGPTLHRIEHEILQPTINRVFQIMNRTGQFPEPPPELEQLAQANGGRINIQFIGPIARARKSAEAASVDAFLNRVIGFGQAMPEMIDFLNPEEIARLAAKVENVPQTLLRSPQQLEELAQQRQAEQAQVQELQRAQLAQMDAQTANQASQAAKAQEGT